MTGMPPWLALLAELPPDARPTRRPVVPESVVIPPEAASMANWYSLVLDLSVPCEGGRVIMATLDGADGTLLSGSDMVYRTTPEANISESLGGRFEPDGTFRGTHWDGITEPGLDERTEPGSFTPRDPTPEEARSLRALLDELCRRAPSS
jgi:hypothetical protein